MIENNSAPLTTALTETLELTGCIMTQHAYQVSPSGSALSITIENLAGQHEVLLELDDHPGNWGVSGLTAVRFRVTRHGDWLLGKGAHISHMHTHTGLSHLPRSKVSSPEQVAETESWVRACPFAPLREFVFQILGQPDIGCAFFSLPASLKHHHCFAGGLARHSLEVAQSVYAVGACFAEHERWLAAVAGLLHDLGKVRCFHTNGRRTEMGYVVSHELLGIELLAPALTRLESSWPDGANALRYLFDWMLRPRQQRPLMPIALTLKQADVMSASADNRQKAFSQLPEWQTFAKDQGPGPASSYWLPSPP